MRLFNTLAEFDQYIPNCLICKKQMKLSIEGRVASVTKEKVRWDSGRETAKMILTLKDDGLYHSSFKSHKYITIDPNTNRIIDGVDFLARIIVNALRANKICNTCHFKISAESKREAWGFSPVDNNTLNQRLESIKKLPSVPALNLTTEELHYTLHGGVDVRISKYHSTTNDENCLATITLNHKHLPPLPLDFDKFRDLTHLNKRLATLKLFH